jgi:hypothetical protein
VDLVGDVASRTRVGHSGFTPSGATRELRGDPMCGPTLQRVGVPICWCGQEERLSNHPRERPNRNVVFREDSITPSLNSKVKDAYMDYGARSRTTSKT